MAADLQEGKAMVERKFQEMLDIGTVAIKDINREFHLQALPAIKRLAKEVGTMVVGRDACAWCWKRLLKELLFQAIS